MDEKFKDVLDNLPALPARSSLEPYRELIEEMRRRGRGYQEITDILGAKFGVRLAVSTVFRFLRRRRKKANTSPRAIAESRGTDQNESVADSTSSMGEAPTYDEVQQRIAALKRKPTPPPPPDVFHYDPNEPLHIPAKSHKSNESE